MPAKLLRWSGLFADSVQIHLYERDTEHVYTHGYALGAVEIDQFADIPFQRAFNNLDCVPRSKLCGDKGHRGGRMLDHRLECQQLAFGDYGGALGSTVKHISRDLRHFLESADAPRLVGVDEYHVREDQLLDNLDAVAPFAFHILHGQIAFYPQPRQHACRNALLTRPDKRYKPMFPVICLHGGQR